MKWFSFFYEFKNSLVAMDNSYTIVIWMKVMELIIFMIIIVNTRFLLC